MSIEIAVRGLRGAGKSVLARHLAEYLKDRGHTVTVSFTVDAAHTDFAPMPSRRIHIVEEWSRDGKE